MAECEHTGDIADLQWLYFPLAFALRPVQFEMRATWRPLRVKNVVERRLQSVVGTYTERQAPHDERSSGDEQVM